MKNKILITYASWAGSTAEIAQAIGVALRDEQTDVDVLDAARVRDISPYQAVVAGGAVRMGRLHRSLPNFVKRFSKALAHVPVAFFVVCTVIKEDTPENRQTAAAYLDKLLRQQPAVKPVEVDIFAGKFTLENLGGLMGWFMKNAKIPEEDYRDWEKISAWAAELKNSLLAENKV